MTGPRARAPGGHSQLFRARFWRENFPTKKCQGTESDAEEMAGMEKRACVTPLCQLTSQKSVASAVVSRTGPADKSCLRQTAAAHGDSHEIVAEPAASRPLSLKKTPRALLCLLQERTFGSPVLSPRRRTPRQAALLCLMSIIILLTPTLLVPPLLLFSSQTAQTTSSAATHRAETTWTWVPAATRTPTTPTRTSRQVLSLMSTFLFLLQKPNFSSRACRASRPLHGHRTVLQRAPGYKPQRMPRCPQ